MEDCVRPCAMISSSGNYPTCRPVWVRPTASSRSDTASASGDGLGHAALRSVRPNKKPGLPTEDEVRAVLGACGETPAGKRSRAMLLVMADAGLRAAEVLRLLVEDSSDAQP